MTFFFHPEARTEFLEAINYFEDCEAGLGLEFSREIYATIHRVIGFPSAWSPFFTNTRRCLVRRFPYGVIYRIRNEAIEILAVMQLNREPDYWRTRT